MAANTGKAYKLAAAALMTAVTAVLSVVAIPTPAGIPLTLQTFAVALTGVFLGPLWGTASVAVYIVTGALGLPVFSNFGSGVGYILGPTGGFIFGFPYLAALAGTFRKRSCFPEIAVGIVGLVICHASGVAWFAAVTARSIGEAFTVASLPFIVKDCISVVCAVFFGRMLLRKLK